MVANFKIKYLNKANKPYFISEIGINHNGKLGLALEMIKKSKMAGFDAVKFQKRDAKDLLNFNYKVGKGTGYLSKNKNLKEAAKKLYKTLRMIKNKNFKYIAVEKIPNKGFGQAINDRLIRASQK